MLTHTHHSIGVALKLPGQPIRRPCPYLTVQLRQRDSCGEVPLTTHNIFKQALLQDGIPPHNPFPAAHAATDWTSPGAAKCLSHDRCGTTFLCGGIRTTQPARKLGS